METNEKRAFPNTVSGGREVACRYLTLQRWYLYQRDREHVGTECEITERMEVSIGTRPTQLVAKICKEGSSRGWIFAQSHL